VRGGAARRALDMTRRIKADPTFEGIDIIGGNVATTEGAGPPPAPPPPSHFFGVNVKSMRLIGGAS